MNTTQDFQRYHELRHRMTELLRSGHHETTEFESCWREIVQIKNRHGGFPPMPDDGTEMELCELANLEGTR